MAVASKSAKLARTKSVKAKKEAAPITEGHGEDHEEEGVADVVPGKVKKPIEIDDPEPVVGTEEKAEEDPLVGASEEEEGADEISLDGEEINPFGDRWEE